MKIEWVDFGREPVCAPDPAYPTGKDIVLAAEGAQSCSAALPYPAKRCGVFIVTCMDCGLSVGITTAGRTDDPRSVRLACNRVPH